MEPFLTNVIKRIPNYDIVLHLDGTELKPLEHPKLLTVKKQTKDCSDGWVLASIDVLSYLYKIELDPSFVVACYGSKHISSFYTKWGCYGDSVS